MNSVRIAVLVVSVLVTAACGEKESSGNGTATLEVWGEWEGELPDEARFLLTLMTCPFTMPPEHDALGVIADGVANARIDGVTPGQWCLTAVIDVDPDDGLLPEAGYDITIVDLPLDGSLPVTLVAGETTVVEVDLELRQNIQTDVVSPMDVVEEVQTEDTVGEIPGPADVWLQVQVACPSCASEAPVIFYGYPGEEMGTIPDLHNKFSQDVSFPGTWVVKDSGYFDKLPIQPGTYIVSAYQDLDDAGLMPEEGEPGAVPLVVELVAGEWNQVSLVLE